MSITGERVVTREGGFNPTWQRHVAAYEAAAALLPPGRCLDLGCGIGHSYELLAPRETVGIDNEPGVLKGQERETHCADMRALPFEDAAFDSVISVQSIEHVPDPERVLEEVRRVLVPGGVAIFATPNRLTFARADEIIDPFHYVEFSPDQLAAICETFFEAVEIRGMYGTQRYLELVAREHAKLDRLLRLDPVGLRKLLPRRARQRLYNWRLTRERVANDPAAAAIESSDFALRSSPLDEALDLFAICRRHSSLIR
jgi:SAM-dependent methyltransferase